MPADRLVAAQTIVKVFDIVVIALIVARGRPRARSRSGSPSAGAGWSSTSRSGPLSPSSSMRFSARSLPSAVTGGIADQGIAGALRSVMASVLARLRSAITTIILIATVALVIVAYVAGRPPWLVRLTSRSAGAAVRRRRRGPLRRPPTRDRRTDVVLHGPQQSDGRGADRHRGHRLRRRSGSRSASRSRCSASRWSWPG